MFKSRLAPYPQRSATIAALPNLWEVAAWEIVHLGSRPWKNVFGKIPYTYSICFMYV